MATSFRDDVPDWVLATAAVVLFLTFVYSVLIAQAILVWFYLAFVVGGGLVFFWLAWRFVVAHERIAAALETGASDAVTGDDVADADRDSPRRG